MLVVDAASTVRLRQVEVLRAIGERVLIGAGLEENDQVAIRALAMLVEGMKVRPQLIPMESGS